MGSNSRFSSESLRKEGLFLIPQADIVNNFFFLTILLRVLEEMGSGEGNQFMLGKKGGQDISL